MSVSGLPLLREHTRARLKVPPQKVLTDRQFFAIVVAETHERPMHELSIELRVGIVPDRRVDHLLDGLWRGKP
jgi:hypothetical protein